MKAFNIRMLSDESDAFVREYVLPYDMSLLDVHEFLCDELGYDAAAGASLFVSDSEWERLTEFTAVDMGDESGLAQPMDGTLLGGVVHVSGDRLIYLFDIFGDRAYYIEVVDTDQNGDAKPACTFSRGDAPDQFDASVSSGSIFDDVMSEFAEFDGDDSYDDE